MSTPRGPAVSACQALSALDALDEQRHAFSDVHRLGRSRLDERRVVDESALDRLDAGQGQQGLGVRRELVAGVRGRQVDEVAAERYVVGGGVEQLVRRRRQRGDVGAHVLEHELGVAVEDRVGALDELDDQVAGVLFVGRPAHHRLGDVRGLGQRRHDGARHFGALARALVGVLLRGVVGQHFLGSLDELLGDDAFGGEVFLDRLEELALAEHRLVAGEHEALQEACQLPAVFRQEAVGDEVLPLLGDDPEAHRGGPVSWLNALREVVSLEGECLLPLARQRLERHAKLGGERAESWVLLDLGDAQQPAPDTLHLLQREGGVVEWARFRRGGCASDCEGQTRRLVPRGGGRDLVAGSPLPARRTDHLEGASGLHIVKGEVLGAVRDCVCLLAIGGHGCRHVFGVERHGVGLDWTGLDCVAGAWVGSVGIRDPGRISALRSS